MWSISEGWLSVRTDSEGWLIHACRAVGHTFGPLCHWKQSGAAMFWGPHLITHDLLDLEGHELCQNCAPLIPPAIVAEIELITQVEKG